MEVDYQNFRLEESEIVPARVEMTRWPNGQARLSQGTIMPVRIRSGSLRFPRLTQSRLQHGSEIYPRSRRATCYGMLHPDYPDQAGSDPGSGLDTNRASPEHRRGLSTCLEYRNLGNCLNYFLRPVFKVAHYRGARVASHFAGRWVYSGGHRPGRETLQTMSPLKKFRDAERSATFLLPHSSRSVLRGRGQPEPTIVQQTLSVACGFCENGGD